MKQLHSARTGEHRLPADAWRLIGCNNTAQPPVAPHSDTEARPSSPEYQPRDSSSYAGNDEQQAPAAPRTSAGAGGAGRNSISTC